MNPNGSKTLTKGVQNVKSFFIGARRKNLALIFLTLLVLY